MSDSMWDWWFGDSPLIKRLRKTFRYRSLKLRRLSIAMIATGTLASSTLTGGFCAPTHAADPSQNLVVSPVSFGWTNAASLSMLVADDSQRADDAQGPNEEARASEKAKASNKDKANNEDERRRLRLRELLKDDDSPSDDDGGSKSKLKDLEDDEAVNDDEDGDFAKPFIEERLPEIAGGRFVLPPIRAVSIDQKPIGNGKVPESLNAGEELTLTALPEDAYARATLTGSPAWPSLIRPWAAPNTFSHPLYFEDRMLERHGHERWGCLQPIAAGARFFATVPMLPYLTTISPPCDTVYSKGYYRAGSPVPRFYQRPPLERRAVIVEAASIATGFIALP